MASRILRVLLIRPESANERFGLGPFFRVEPLGLLLVASALRARGHQVRLLDLRFTKGLDRALSDLSPDLVGISCMHAVDIPATLAVAAQVKRRRPSCRVLVGGHVPAVYPDPFFVPQLDAIALSDVEALAEDWAEAICEEGRGAVPKGLARRREPGSGREHFEFADAQPIPEDPIPSLSPAVDLAEPYRHHYLCVHKQPLWALETARGCPYRCNFCSTSRKYQRKTACHPIDRVSAEWSRAGKNLFIVDDLFFFPEERSLELALALGKKGLGKEWILAQARLDTVAQHPQLLEAWRPLAQGFDLFFGFEARCDEQLRGLDKDCSISAIEEGVRVARRLGYGVTGNFVIDPDFTEQDFDALWELVDKLGLHRVGYTVLTPLPGTPRFEALRSRIVEWDWARWDMHHLLYEPRLGRRRFFERFVQGWRRNILSPRTARGRFRAWAKGLTFAQMLTLLQLLYRSRRMLDVEAYLRETFPLQLPFDLPGDR